MAATFPSQRAAEPTFSLPLVNQITPLSFSPCLQGVLDSADWDMFRKTVGGDINDFMDAIVGFIEKKL